MILTSNAPPVIKVSDCKTEEQLVAALLHLREITPTIPPRQLYNHQERIDAAINRLNKMKIHLKELEIEELENKDRIFYYHRAVILSVEFLKAHPDMEALAQLFTCLKEAFKLTGSKWYDKTMYSDIIDFDKACTKGEKKIYFINKILQSGLHERHTIRYIINMYIKLVNILQLNDKLPVDIPKKSNLHDLQFVDLKY